MNEALALLETGEAILAALRMPISATLDGLLNRRQEQIAALPSSLPPGLGDRLRRQDELIHHALGSLMKVMRRQMRYCEQPAPPPLRMLVDACR